jgi:hypothetical protein
MLVLMLPYFHTDTESISSRHRGPSHELHQLRKVETYDVQARLSPGIAAKDLTDGFNFRCIAGNSARSVCFDV